MRVLLKNVGLLFAGALVALPAAFAQTGWVHLETNQIDAAVYADTTWLGTAEAGIFQIPQGSQRLILVPKSVDAWSIESLTTSLDGAREDTLQIDLSFPYYYRLESVPSGADVYLTEGGQRRLLGQSPIDHVSENPLSGELIFDLDFHVSRQVSAGSEIWNRHLVLMEAESQMDPIIDSGIVSRPNSTAWIDYVAIGTTVVGGLLAVHYKTKADKLYDEFTESRDFDLKPDIDQFDLYSGVALGAMQVGLGVLAIRLIF